MPHFRCAPVVSFSTQAVCWVVLGLLLFAPLAPAPGLIKPDFTPIQLVANSKVIVEATLGRTASGSLALTPRRALRGALPPQLLLEAGSVDEQHWKTIVDYAATHSEGLTVAWLQGASAQGDLSHSLCTLHGQWMIITPTSSGAWEAQRDTADLNGVWAGSGAQLIAAMTYIMNDPKADMPVITGATWKGQQVLATISGTVAMTMTATVPSLGPCLIIAASDGDRIIRTAAHGGRAGDATADIGLRGSSKLIAAGDATGTGVVDLVRWSGTELSVYSLSQRTSTPVPGAPPDLRGLAVASGGHMVAFTATAPAILRLKGGALPLAAPQAAWGDGMAGCVADLDGDGISDIVQAFSKGLVVWKGRSPTTFASPACVYAGELPQSHTLLVFDADADGLIDVLVAGSLKDHPLLRNLGGLRFVNALSDGGELEYHAPRGSVAASLIDINLDGRTDVLLFPKRQSPKLYFNRGFACFGYAREIHLDSEQSPPAIRPAAQALGDGCLGGAAIDIDADGQTDVMAIANNGTVLALMTVNDIPERMSVTIAPNPAVGPLIINARDGTRPLGTRLASAAQPAVYGKKTKGPLVVTWTAADGSTQSKSVVILKSQTVSIP